MLQHRQSRATCSKSDGALASAFALICLELECANGNRSLPTDPRQQAERPEPQQCAQGGFGDGLDGKVIHLATNTGATHISIESNRIADGSIGDGKGSDDRARASDVIAKVKGIVIRASHKQLADGRSDVGSTGKREFRTCR